MPRLSDSRASTPLNAVRCTRSMTVRELSKRTGIPRSSLSDYLVGRTRVPRERAQRLARVLELTDFTIEDGDRS